MTQIVSYKGKDFNSLERLIELELNKLQKWINTNKLTINLDPRKSSYCIFKPRSKCFPVYFNRGIRVGSNINTFLYIIYNYI